jgi:cell division protease FtsH
MAQLTQKLQEQILEKHQLLETARAQLKTEFFGIDTVIDEIINSISSWFLFPDIQDKPLIINLWGMTGVGKTSLIVRLCELINFSKRFYRFDMGESGAGEWGMKRHITQIQQECNGLPLIIGLDEFQLCRTINEHGKELDHSFTRIIWDLLDSGKFQTTVYSRDVDRYSRIRLKIEYIMQQGAKSANGILTSCSKLYVELRHNFDEPVRGKVRIFNKDDRNRMWEVVRYQYVSYAEFNRYLDTLDLEGSHKFLGKLIDMELSPKVIDCSRSVIFVMGNLDEAYHMSDEINPDISADEFHEASLKITITHIKHALQRRFRNEQIARLGNNHIIYPAFSKETFNKIIAHELKKATDAVQEKYNISINIQQSVHQLIYNEGVFPTQGTRPVFTTISQIIKSRFSRIFSEMLLKNINASEITISALSDVIQVVYLKKENIVHQFEEKVTLNLDKLRQTRKDDMQTIAAVHESGHAVLAIALLKTIPEMVYSVTADSESEGFTFTKTKWNYLSKNEIINRLAKYLGGYAAEKIIFGEDNITAGSESDIYVATKLISRMYKSSGMMGITASFNIEDPMTNNDVYDRDDIINNASINMLKEALQLAEITLQSHKQLLLKLSDHLSDHTFIRKELIREMVRIHAPGLYQEGFIENGDLLFYRKHLKEQTAQPQLASHQTKTKLHDYRLKKDKVS